MDPKTDYSAWKFWFDAAQYGVTVFVAAYVWLCNRANARQKDMNNIEKRVIKIETVAISHQDIAAVYDRINGISDQVSNLSGKMDGVRGAVDMIQEHLLNNGGKK